MNHWSGAEPRLWFWGRGVYGCSSPGWERHPEQLVYLLCSTLTEPCHDKALWCYPACLGHFNHWENWTAQFNHSKECLIDWCNLTGMWTGGGGREGIDRFLHSSRSESGDRCSLYLESDLQGAAAGSELGQDAIFLAEAGYAHVWCLHRRYLGNSHHAMRTRDQRDEMVRGDQTTKAPPFISSTASQWDEEATFYLPTASI